MENPFGTIELKLSKIERLILNLSDERQHRRRAVNINEFAAYSGLSKSTIYSYLSKGTNLPGAFKPKGTKKWYFNLDAYDRYIQEEMEKAEAV